MSFEATHADDQHLFMDNEVHMTMLLVPASKILPGTPVIVSHEVDQIYGVLIEKAVHCPEGRYFSMAFLTPDFASKTVEYDRGYPKSYWTTPKAYYKDTEWGSPPFGKVMSGSMIVLKWTGDPKNLHFYVPIEACLIPIKT